MNHTYNKAVPDYHLHSRFSADCETEISDIIKKSKSLGLDTICITDHNDLDFPDVPDHIKFDLDIDSYILEIKKIREEVHPDFDLRCGIEQGVMPSTCDKLNNYSKEHPGLDFIICSSHVVDGMDPYYIECWSYDDGTPKDADKLYLTYFEEMLYNVTHFSDYNVYGHIDYIFRYGPEHVTSEIFSGKYYNRLKELFHEIMKSIVESGKGIEINTGSLYRGMDYMHPHELLLKMYKDAGGEILTFGSDAHDTEHIGYAFDKAMDMAIAHGFKYHTTFKDMKPEFLPLK